MYWALESAKDCGVDCGVDCGLESPIKFGAEYWASEAVVAPPACRAFDLLRPVFFEIFRELLISVFMPYFKG
jgi:hypothetical protein